MTMALELAARARGRTSPNPMVGAVVVKDGQVVGKGCHLKAGTPHAEIHALREAGEKARGATLYVTLEPCCHHGRTGPCTEAILNAGIAQVFVAMTDPNPLVAGKGIELLRQAGVKVESGLLKEEALRLNEVFIKYISSGLPFVVLKAAMSLDGKIATRTGESQWITGPEARSQGHQLRDWYDAILVGVGTVLADNPSLTTRLPGNGGRDPLRVILDSTARTPPDAKVINQESTAATVVAVTPQAPPERIEALKKAGAEVLVVPPKNSGGGDAAGVDLAELMQQLGKREITSVLIEGGGRVHGSALASGIADKVVWFIAPKIIGGNEAPGPVGGTGIDRLANAVRLRDIELKCVGDDICIKGYISNRGGKLCLPD